MLFTKQRELFGFDTLQFSGFALNIRPSYDERIVCVCFLRPAFSVCYGEQAIREGLRILSIEDIGYYLSTGIDAANLHCVGELLGQGQMSVSLVSVFAGISSLPSRCTTPFCAYKTPRVASRETEVFFARASVSASPNFMSLKAFCVYRSTQSGCPGQALHPVH